MSESFRLLILASAAAATLVLVWQRQRIRSEWDVTATVVFGVAWLLNARHLAAALTGDYVLTPVALRPGVVEVSYGATAATATRVALLLLVTGSVVFGLVRLSRGARVNAPGMVAFGVMLTSLFGAWFTRAPMEWQLIVPMAAVLWLAVMCEPGSGARLGAAVFGITTTVVSAALLMRDPVAATRPCGAKCGLLDALYTGVFENGNAFGLTLAVALPFVLLSFRGLPLLVLVAALGIAALGAESRTGQGAMLATLAVFVVSRGRNGRLVAAGAALTVSTVALVLPFATAGPNSQAFTGRGYRWALAIDSLRGDWLVGLGSGSWARLAGANARVGAEAAYSPHNQWLDVLFSAGALGVLLFAALLVTLYRSARVEDRTGIALVLVAVMSIGTLERAWGFNAADWLFWSLLATCLAGRPPTTRAAGRRRLVMHCPESRRS